MKVTGGSLFMQIFGIFINVLMDVLSAENSPGPEVIKRCFSCSTHNSITFIHAINFKTPTYIDIFNVYKQDKYINWWGFRSRKQLIL